VQDKVKKTQNQATDNEIISTSVSSDSMALYKYCIIITIIILNPQYLIPEGEILNAKQVDHSMYYKCKSSYSASGC